jgi:hypothetical protein
VSDGSGGDDAQKINVLTGFVPNTVDFSQSTLSDHVVSCSVQLGITKIAREATGIFQMCCSSAEVQERSVSFQIHGGSGVSQR